MINYCCKLVSGNMNKLSSTLYRILLDDFLENRYIYDWFSCIKSIFDSVGMSYIWFEQNGENSNWLTANIQSILEAQFKQDWFSSILNSSKCTNYRLFKSEHKFENYLIRLPPKLMYHFINYRLCNNRLPIEIGRWNRLDRHLRKCMLCNSNAVGDEFHYVYECAYFDFDRSILTPFIRKRGANCLTFSNLFNENNICKLRKLCKFLGVIISAFKQAPG